MNERMYGMSLPELLCDSLIMESNFLGTIKSADMFTRERILWLLMQK